MFRGMFSCICMSIVWFVVVVVELCLYWIECLFNEYAFLISKNSLTLFIYFLYFFSLFINDSDDITLGVFIWAVVIMCWLVVGLVVVFIVDVFCGLDEINV